MFDMQSKIAHIDYTLTAITNERCMMVWDNKTVHVQGTLYWVDTTQPDTAFNGSFEQRIHPVTTVENKQ